jgi:hypothetical protein
MRVMGIDYGERRIGVAVSAAAADWLTDALEDPWLDGVVRVGAIVPAGFEAYVRVEHTVGGEDGDAREGSLPRPAADRLVTILAGHTSTPERCWLAVWSGWGDMPSTSPIVHHPGRDYVLLSAALPMAARPLWSDDLGGSGDQSPSLWWPDDRAWVVATEVDFAWTYVGGTTPLIDTLRRDSGIRTRIVQPDDDAHA